MDFHSHGTHCAGTIAAAVNGAGVVGVAPSAYLYAVKVLSKTGSGQISWIISGIDWCINNRIKIISMSLGPPSAPAALETMCNAAWSKGLLLVAAAGNSGPGMGTVDFPGKYKNVIAVSAIDSSNVIASFSSRGPEVELCAPGVNVLSTIPAGGYGTKSGTSMACPHVAGAAAVVWGSHRFSTNETIWNLLATTADNLGNPGWDPEYGYGRVDVENAACELTPPPAVSKKP
jgi:subtilisin